MNIINEGKIQIIKKEELLYNNNPKTPLNNSDFYLYQECQKALSFALDGVTTKYLDVNFISQNIFSHHHSGMFKVLNDTKEVQNYPIKLGLELNFYEGMKSEPNNKNCSLTIQKKLKEYFQKKALQEHNASSISYSSKMGDQHLQLFFSNYSGYLVPDYNKAVYFYQDSQSFCLRFGDKNFVDIENMFPPEKIKLFREYLDLKNISKETLHKSFKKISL